MVIIQQKSSLRATSGFIKWPNCHGTKLVAHEGAAVEVLRFRNSHCRECFADPSGEWQRISRKRHMQWRTQHRKSRLVVWSVDISGLRVWGRKSWCPLIKRQNIVKPVAGIVDHLSPFVHGTSRRTVVMVSWGLSRVCYSLTDDRSYNSQPSWGELIRRIHHSGLKNETYDPPTHFPRA